MGNYFSSYYTTAIIPGHRHWNRHATAEKLEIVDGNSNIKIGNSLDTPAHLIETLVTIDGVLTRVRNISYGPYGQAEVCTCPSTQDHYTTLWSLS